MSTYGSKSSLSDVDVNNGDRTHSSSFSAAGCRGHQPKVVPSVSGGVKDCGTGYSSGGSLAKYEGVAKRQEGGDMPTRRKTTGKLPSYLKTTKATESKKVNR